MNGKRVFYILFLNSILMTSCRFHNPTFNKPNYKLAKSFDIDSSELVYQYYQKFGFTESCEDLRILSIKKDFVKLKKKLPFDSLDLTVINNFPNKSDPIIVKTLAFDSNLRKDQYDIELDFLEFKKDSSLSFSLNIGEYEIEESELVSTLRVFDRESGLLYIEMHRCDGH